MKTSVSKIIKRWLNKTNLTKYKKYLNQQTIPVVIATIFILLVLSYFLRPIYFNYEDNKKNFQNRIYSDFKVKINFNKEISYRFFPSPRIIINEAKINLTENSKKKIKIKELIILISPFKLQNIQNLSVRKIVINNQLVQVYPEDFNNYFNYMTIEKNKTIYLKNSNIFFVDQQGNKVLFNKVSYKENFSKKKHQIESVANFSANKIKMKFINRENSKKYLKINVPRLKQSLDITFDKDSNLDYLSGELKLKFLETLLLMNFSGKGDFKITDSYLRNKFLNSKINGKISFKENFYFDLVFGVNQINFRKLLLYYPIFQTGRVSKKINGKIIILNKNTESFFGKIKDTKMTLIFENGDLKIKNLSTKITDNSKINSDISILNNDDKSIIKFKLNFFTNEAPKFLRRFGLYDFKQDQVSLVINGNIDVNKKKINLIEVIKDRNERINNKQILNIEKSFNKHVLDEGILGLFDFFKFKKFIQETY